MQWQFHDSILHIMINAPIQVDFSRVVFEGARVMAANRLATSGMEWADTFKRENRYKRQSAITQVGGETHNLWPAVGLTTTSG